jgi:hypothetical protein
MSDLLHVLLMFYMRYGFGLNWIVKMILGRKSMHPWWCYASIMPCYALLCGARNVIFHVDFQPAVSSNKDRVHIRIGGRRHAMSNHHRAVSMCFVFEMLFGTVKPDMRYDRHPMLSPGRLNVSCHPNQWKSNSSPRSYWVSFLVVLVHDSIYTKQNAIKRSKPTSKLPACIHNA